jgi:hypothetical protein
MTVLARRISQINIRPVRPARHAAARLRRAFDGPILAAPPVRAIQTSILLESSDGRIVLNYKGKTLHKERNDWLVLTRTSVAGFNAPRDRLIQMYTFT